jgi:hypothetical protein
MYTTVHINKIYQSIPNINCNSTEEVKLSTITVHKLIEAFKLNKLLTFDGTIHFQSLGFDDSVVDCKVGKGFIKVGNISLVVPSLID